MLKYSTSPVESIIIFPLTLVFLWCYAMVWYNLVLANYYCIYGYYFYRYLVFGLCTKLCQ